MNRGLCFCAMSRIVNITRRHLTKGQQAMIIVKARFLKNHSQAGGLGYTTCITNPKLRELVKFLY
jgi:hypothetical protein